MDKKVSLSLGSVLCGQSEGAQMLWRQLSAETLTYSALPCESPQSWPWPSVLLADEPKSTELGVCRKTQRTMEKQAKLILLAAKFAEQQAITDGLLYRPATTGLYLSIPTIDEPIPPWTMLEAMMEYGYRVEDQNEWMTGEFLTREIPAFFGLSTLNSNACAYISAQFNLTGEMAAYSNYADSALQAVIDAHYSIAEATNTQALVGAVAPKINPLLLLQYDYRQYQGSFAVPPVEGAGFVWMQPENIDQDRVLLSGCARGFIPDAKSKAENIQRLIEKALERSHLRITDIDWFISSGDHAEKTLINDLANPQKIPLFDLMMAIGNAGGATSIIGLNLGLLGLRTGRILSNASGKTQEIEKNIRHIAISAMGPEGQYVVIVLSGVKV